MAKKGKKKITTKGKMKEKITIKETKEKEATTPKRKNILYITKKVFSDHMLTTIYYKDGSKEEIKRKITRRA